MVPMFELDGNKAQILEKVAIPYCRTRKHDQKPNINPAALY